MIIGKLPAIYRPMAGDELALLAMENSGGKHFYLHNLCAELDSGIQEFFSMQIRIQFLKFILKF